MVETQLFRVVMQITRGGEYIVKQTFLFETDSADTPEDVLDQIEGQVQQELDTDMFTQTNMKVVSHCEIFPARIVDQLPKCPGALLEQDLLLRKTSLASRTSEWVKDTITVWNVKGEDE